MGLVVAVMYVLYNNYKKPYFFHIEAHKPGEAIRLELAQDVTFINKAAMLKTLNQLPDNSKVIIDASRSIHIDHDVIEIIEDFQTNAPTRGIEVEVIDLVEVKIVNQHKQFAAKVLNGGTKTNGKLELANAN